MTTQALYDLALHGNDSSPDHLCPACGQDITGYLDSPYSRYHYRADAKPSYLQTIRRLNERRAAECRWPFTTSRLSRAVCSWTCDDLAGRAHARRIIREGVTE